MADTRCANSQYQLEVDEMTLEYLVYNTLKAHIDEWDANYRTNPADGRTAGDKASKTQAPTLLAILDTTVRLFKANHPGQPWSEDTAFYFKLLEFLLLLSHGRGGPSVLSEGSCSTARHAGKENIQRKIRCWEAHEQLSKTLHGPDRELLSLQCVHGQGKASSTDDDQVPNLTDTSDEIPLVDLLPLFMEISAKIVKLTQSDVSKMWLELACEFMVQAAIDVGFRAGNSPHSLQATHALMACFGWGLPIELSNFSLVMGVEDAAVAETEKAVHQMLRSTGNDEKSSPTVSWDDQRRRGIEEVMTHILTGNGQRADESGGREPDMRQVINVQFYHPAEEFEVQMLHYIKNLQTAWAQLNGEPILLQIEQGRLEGLDNEEFSTFMERVGNDEHEANLERIQIPAMFKT